MPNLPPTTPNAGRWRLPPDDLLMLATYRRLWTSILISSLGAQVLVLAIPLTAATLLNANPTQMGFLSAVETLPFVLFSLPAGVWLDRVRKLPVYVAGEVTLALAVATVPLAHWLGVLRMEWLYAVGFILGTVYAVSGSAAQVVLTQVVPRQRLVEAHARNALATSGAEVAGPGLAGALIKLVGPPLALLMDAALVLGSALILKGVRANDAPRAGGAGNFMVDLRAGMAFVVGQPLLVVMAVVVGGWQVAQHSAMAVQVLLATRELGLTEEHLGLCYALMGLGTIAASVVGNRISARVGPGRALALGFLCSGAGWSVGALSPAGNAGVATFVVMLVLVAVGGVFIFINFLALRQASTPEPLLGRMTTTMRWLILLPAGPGAVIGGLLGDHVGLRAALGFSGVLSTVLGVASLRHPRLRQLRQLPTPP